MEFFDIQAPIEWGFTLKRIRDIIRTYNQYWKFHCYHIHYHFHGNIFTLILHWIHRKTLIIFNVSWRSYIFNAWGFFSRSPWLVVTLSSLPFLHQSISYELNYLKVIWNIFVTGSFYNLQSDYTSFCFLSYLIINNLTWILYSLGQSSQEVFKIST